tara:strand:+ start:1314 stop:1523 length:210 start_codon:yes stop_codon:yes gene_type:complete
MAYVKSYVTMYKYLEWVGEIPDSVKPDNRRQWIKDNVDGGEYGDTGGGDWSMDFEVEVDKEDYNKWISV